MDKGKTLIKNTAIIGIGSLGTKVLTFLLLPIYTAVLTTEDYGMIDVLMTVSSLVIPFATLEMGSGIFRFIIGKDEHEDIKGTISTGVVAELLGLTVAVMITLIINIFYQIPHCGEFILYFVSMSLVQLLSNIARGLGNNVLYSVSNFTVTLISLLLNLLFILVLRVGGVSILIATSLGNICGSVLIILGQKLWCYFSIKRVNTKIFAQMVKYTLPLVPNTVSWWVVSASDRLLILLFLGASVNGIYAAANKIPGIYTTIFSVYSLAWTEAVARNMDDKNFISKTFQSSIRVMVYMLLGIITCSSLFFKILIGSNYSDSYWHIFILLFAIFFSSCSSLLGGIFGAKFESKTVMITTLIGAFINVLINLIGIRFIGLYAASFSTLIAYFVVFVVRLRKCRKWYSLKLFCKDDLCLVALFFLVVCGYLLRINWLNMLIIVCIIFLFVLQNRSMAKAVINKLIRHKVK